MKTFNISTGKPKKLTNTEYIFEKTFAELKYFIHIKKTNTLMKNDEFFINCLDFVLYLMKKIKNDIKIYGMPNVSTRWGALSTLV